MNKKQLLAAIIFSVLSVAAYAQMSVGFISGASLSKFKVGFVDDKNEPYFSTSAAVGFHAGVSMNIPFSESIGLHPSIMFSQKGNKLAYVKPNSTFEQQNYQSNHSVNYIEVPLLLKYNFGGESMGLSLMAGPDLNFALGGKISERGNVEFYDENTGQPFIGKVNENKDVKIGSKVNSNYRAFDAGLALGLGAYFNVGETGQFIIEARWVSGGSNILNANYISSPTYDKIVVTKDVPTANVTNYNIVNNKEIVGEIRNRSFQFSVGYMFKFSEKY